MVASFFVIESVIRFIDMFSGIGGFREGLTRAGGFTCVGHCEIDKYANRSCNALFDTKGERFIEDTLTTGCRQGTVEVRPVKNPIKSDLARNTERTGKPGAPMHTLTTKDRHGVLCEGRIRRLTPRECLRLQGWADDRIDTVLAIQSDNQAYKQAGNGVTVNVVEAIGRRIAKMDAELRGEALAP